MKNWKIEKCFREVGTNFLNNGIKPRVSFYEISITVQKCSDYILTLSVTRACKSIVLFYSLPKNAKEMKNIFWLW